mgnify:CR=1 FL=1
MSEKLPCVTAKQIIAVVQARGFMFSRASGSHQIFKNADGKRVTVPFHAQKILHPKVLKGILRDAGMSVTELKRLL